MKKYSTSKAINELVIKTPMRYWATHLSAWLKLEILTMPNADKDAEQLDHSYVAVGNVK